MVVENVVAVGFVAGLVVELVVCAVVGIVAGSLVRGAGDAWSFRG